MQLFETKSDLKIKFQALQKDFFFKTEIVNSWRAKRQAD